MAFDLAVRQSIHSLASPPLTRLMLGITSLGNDLTMIAIATAFIVWLIMAARYRDTVLFVSTCLAAWLFYTGFNTAFHRPRPMPFFGLPTPGGFSFPSGHAVKSMVVYLAIAMLGTQRIFLRAVAFAFAAAVGISRVYLGVHYPTDVLAGWAVAGFCLIVLRYRSMPV